VGILSRCARIIVLLEDARHEQFIRKYLRERGFSHREIQVEPAPAGKSKDVNFVLERYAAEANAQRNAHYSRGLIVVIDADDYAVPERKSQLDEKLHKAGYARRAEAEAIAIVVPSRNIETWIWYFLGNSVEEATNYKTSQLGSGSDVASEVKRHFADYIVSGQEPFSGCPPALQDARVELNRVPHK